MKRCFFLVQPDIPRSSRKSQCALVGGVGRAHYPEASLRCYRSKDQHLLETRYPEPYSYRHLNGHDVVKTQVCHVAPTLFMFARNADHLLRHQRRSDFSRMVTQAGRREGVILYSSSEVDSPRPTSQNIVKCARAYRNMSNVISSNASAINYSPVLQNSTQDHSLIVDFKRQVITEMCTGSSMVGYALIDIERLQEACSKPAMTNLLARQRLSPFR